LLKIWIRLNLFIVPKGWAFNLRVWWPCASVALVFDVWNSSGFGALPHAAPVPALEPAVVSCRTPNLGYPVHRLSRKQPANKHRMSKEYPASPARCRCHSFRLSAADFDEWAVELFSLQFNTTPPTKKFASPAA